MSNVCIIITALLIITVITLFLLWWFGIIFPYLFVNIIYPGWVQFPQGVRWFSPTSGEKIEIETVTPFTIKQMMSIAKQKGYKSFGFNREWYKSDPTNHNKMYFSKSNDLIVVKPGEHVFDGNSVTEIYADLSV